MTSQPLPPSLCIPLLHAIEEIAKSHVNCLMGLNRVPQRVAVSSWPATSTMQSPAAPPGRDNDDHRDAILLQSHDVSAQSTSVLEHHSACGSVIAQARVDEQTRYMHSHGRSAHVARDMFTVISDPLMPRKTGPVIRYQRYSILICSATVLKGRGTPRGSTCSESAKLASTLCSCSISEA